MTDERFERLWSGSERAVVATVARIARDANADERADLVQDARIKAWRFRDAYDEAHSFVHWVCVIATNLCRDRVRRGKGARRTLSLIGEDWSESMVDDAPSPLDRMTAKELSERLPVALLTLKPSLRRVVALFAEGRSHEEIAAITDVPIGTVRSRLFRARQAMRARLAPRP